MATPPPALPCESPPPPRIGALAGAGPGLEHGFAAAGLGPCRLLSPGEGPAPSPHARRGGPAASYVNLGNPNLGDPGVGARAVGVAVGGEAGALPASLHGGSGGSLHCNPIFSHALQHSRQVRSLPASSAGSTVPAGGEAEFVTFEGVSLSPVIFPRSVRISNCLGHVGRGGAGRDGGSAMRVHPG